MEEGVVIGDYLVAGCDIHQPSFGNFEFIIIEQFIIFCNPGFVKTIFVGFRKQVIKKDTSTLSNK